jgi:hypothetical protein
MTNTLRDVLAGGGSNNFGGEGASSATGAQPATGGAATATSPTPAAVGGGGGTSPMRILVASMNVGNAALKADQLHHWLKWGRDAEVVAVGLQESVSYHGYSTKADGDDVGSDESEEEDGDDLLDDGADNGGAKGAAAGTRTPHKGNKEKEAKTSVKAAIREKLMLDGDNVLDALLEHLNTPLNSDGRPSLGSADASVPWEEQRPSSTSSRSTSSRYKLEASYMRGEMRLLVFTRTTPRFPVHSVETAAVNTGLKYHPLRHLHTLVLVPVFLHRYHCRRSRTSTHACVPTPTRLSTRCCHSYTDVLLVSVAHHFHCHCQRPL